MTRLLDRAAYLAALHADLLAADSATAVLERVFQTPITIRRLRPGSPAPSSTQRTRLAVTDQEPVANRHVALVSGGRIFSEADLWYVPSRLPPDMRVRLDSTDTPFGHVARPLNLRRVTLDARICGPTEAWSLDHRALLILPDQQPVAEVWERYSLTLFTGS